MVLMGFSVVRRHGGLFSVFCPNIRSCAGYVFIDDLFKFLCHMPRKKVCRKFVIGIIGNDAKCVIRNIFFKYCFRYFKRFGFSSADDALSKMTVSMPKYSHRVFQSFWLVLCRNNSSLLLLVMIQKLARTGIISFFAFGTGRSRSRLSFLLSQ